MPDIIYLPNLSLSEQLFYFKGGASAGGFTAGGVRSYSPDPGGFSMLEMSPNIQMLEKSYPNISWLMSQPEGVVFRTRLICSSQLIPATLSCNWNDSANWRGDESLDEVTTTKESSWTTGGIAYLNADTPISTSSVVIDISDLEKRLGTTLKKGHLIGHGFSTYTINSVKTLPNFKVKLGIYPPLRKAGKEFDLILFKPWFTGTLNNVQEFKSTYKASEVGGITPNRLILDEVIL